MFVTSTAQRRGNRSTTNGVVPKRYDAEKAAPGFRTHQFPESGTTKRKRTASIGGYNATGLVIQGDMDAPVDRTKDSVGTIQQDVTFPVTFATNRTPIIQTPLRIPSVIGDSQVSGTVHIKGNLFVDGSYPSGGGGVPPYDPLNQNDALLDWNTFEVVFKSNGLTAMTKNGGTSFGYYTVVNDMCFFRVRLEYTTFVAPTPGDSLYLKNLPRVPLDSDTLMFPMGSQRGYAAPVMGDTLVLRYVQADTAFEFIVRNDTQLVPNANVDVERFVDNGFIDVFLVYKYVKQVGDRGYVP